MKAFIIRMFQLLLLICLLSLCTVIKAQGIRKGSISLLGQGTYSSSQSDYSSVLYKQSSYSASIKGNYFFADNICVMLGYEYSSNSFKQEDAEPNDSSFYLEGVSHFNSAGILFRKYVFLNDFLAFYLQLGYDYGTGRFDQTASGILGIQPDYVYQQHRIMAAPGIVFFPAKRFAIETAFGTAEFSKRRQQFDNPAIKDFKVTESEANLVPTLNIGVQYFLVRR